MSPARISSCVGCSRRYAASSPASTSRSRPTPGVLLPGTLASPRAGLPPAGCRELVARLHRRFLLSVSSAPELLDAVAAATRQAILELAKMKEIVPEQARTHGDILIMMNSE